MARTRRTGSHNGATLLPPLAALARQWNRLLLQDAATNCARKRGASMRIDPISIVSARPKTGLAEQLLELARLCPPIGRRRADLAAERGGGVPAPARIVEHAARECDHVGLAGSNDIFGLLRLGYLADRDGRQPRGPFDGLNKRHRV